MPVSHTLPKSLAVFVGPFLSSGTHQVLQNLNFNLNLIKHYNETFYQKDNILSKYSCADYL